MREKTQKELDVFVRSVAPMIDRYANLHARGWKKSHLPDLVNLGNEAAIRFARGFDADRGIPFAGAVQPFIAGTMLAYVTRESRERNAMILAARTAHYGQPYSRPTTEWDAWDDAGPKERTARAAREARLQVQRLAAAALMASDAPIHPEDIYLEREEIQHAVDTLNAVLASFTSEHRTAFRLHMIQGLSQEEVATRLRVSSRTVLRYLRAVEEGLRRGLVEAGIESQECLRQAWFVVSQSADEAP